MIDTAVSSFAQDAVETALDAVDTARELAQDRLHDVTYRTDRARRARRKRGVMLLLVVVGAAGLAFFVVAASAQARSSCNFEATRAGPVRRGRRARTKGDTPLNRISVSRRIVSEPLNVSSSMEAAAGIEPA